MHTQTNKQTNALMSSLYCTGAIASYPDGGTSQFLLAFWRRRMSPLREVEVRCGSK